MQLQLQNFTTIVSNAAAAVQGAARQLIDLTVGSTLRAVLEANAALALWIQWLIVQVLATTRAATSVGADLDSWVADFSTTRLPASFAVGRSVFSRFTPSQTALIPPGTGLQSSDGSQNFIVTTDTTNPAWTVALSGYSLGQGVGSVTVPIQALAPGSAGNVQPGTITLLASALPGIDTVTNTAALAGGLDAESDAALRLRFSSYLASRARATPVAIGNAILSVQQGITYTLQENFAPDGTIRMGSFVVTVDDGSGTPPSSLLASVAGAVEAMRPIGSLYTIQPPILVPANVTLAVTTAVGTIRPSVAANVTLALSAQINSLPIGASLPWSKLSQIAYSADPAVINVTAALLNGGTADLAVPAAGLIRVASIQVN